MRRVLATSVLLVALGSEPGDVCEHEDTCKGSEPVAMLQAQALSKNKANCTGPHCGRGHPAFLGPMSALQTQRGGAFDVFEDGTWNTYYLPGADISADRKSVTYGINDKYYLMKQDTTDYQKPENFKMIKLNGKTMITEVDLNGAGCGCNVNFFLVSMPAHVPGQYNDYYCDANCVGGNCCPEFDVNEMNTHAVQITNHNCWDPWSKQTCDGGGNPDTRFYPGEYGPGENNKVDTNKPFNYSVQILEVINPQNSAENHLVVTTRMWQEGRVPMSRSMGGIGSPMNSMWGHLADGMVLVVDYWQSSDLTWLDGGKGCSAPEHCSGNKATLKNMQLISNNNPALDASCPAMKSECGDCSWATQAACNNDDGSECWCCCCCSRGTNVPRCTWGGYVYP